MILNGARPIGGKTSAVPAAGLAERHPAEAGACPRYIVSSWEALCDRTTEHGRRG